ncbi:MAG: tRNA pseudouridine(38-40) synthase TruA [Pseudomonadota bacterium]|nr:tRNA pseudouridine(38-40) synthase TruA [Pseudomonadota bacterium]
MTPPTPAGAGPPPGRTRIALGLEYDGSRYHGWEAQRHTGLTVQATLERALARIADAPVRTVVAGRTDTGVHAAGQVVHFETDAQRPARAWVLGTNSHLPADVSVSWAQAVPADFHARFSARWRVYRYLLMDRRARSALRAGRVCWRRYPLDHGRMHAAAQALVGEHDFSAFRGADCQAHSPIRQVQWLRVRRRGELVIVDIRANAFLHHMVRNIVGSLLPIGEGSRPAGWLGEVLAARDRRAAGVTAPAAGLYLVAVGYPDHALPSRRPTVLGVF